MQCTDDVLQNYTLETYVNFVNQCYHNQFNFKKLLDPLVVNQQYIMKQRIKSAL